MAILPSSLKALAALSVASKNGATSASNSQSRVWRACWLSHLKLQHRARRGKVNSRSDAVMEYYCRPFPEALWMQVWPPWCAAAESSVSSTRAHWQKRTAFPFSLFLLSPSLQGRAVT